MSAPLKTFLGLSVSLEGSSFGKFEIAGYADATDLEDRTLVDSYRDDERIAVAGDGGVADMHVQIAVVVVEGGQAVDVFLQLVVVEHAGVEEAAQQIMLARLHQSA